MRASGIGAERARGSVRWEEGGEFGEIFVVGGFFRRRAVRFDFSF